MEAARDTVRNKPKTITRSNFDRMKKEYTMKRTLIITVILALALTAGMALAADPADTTDNIYAPWCWRNDITMTDAQNEKLDELQEKYWEKSEAVMDKIDGKQDQLEDIYRDDSPDYTKADALEDDIYDLNRELIELRRDYRDEARGVLTDEQLSEYPGAFCGGYGLGYGRGSGMGYGMGSGRGFGMGYDTGYGRGSGRGCWRSW